MRFAPSLALIALGAILALAVNAHPRGINLNAVGWILILVGLAGMQIAYWLQTSRRRTDIIQRSDGGRTVIEPNAPPPEEDLFGPF